MAALEIITPLLRKERKINYNTKIINKKKGHLKPSQSTEAQGGRASNDSGSPIRQAPGTPMILTNRTYETMNSSSTDITGLSRLSISNNKA